jgi:DNA-binding NarL/FixJ family response regulator
MIQTLFYRLLDSFLHFGFLLLPLDRDLIQTLQARAINANASCSAYVCDLIRSHLDHENKGEDAMQIWRTLTLRQRQVAFLIYQGFTYQEIGDKLDRAPDTIKGNARDMMKLFGVRGKRNFRGLLALLPEEYLNAVQDYETPA